ncbi:MAG: hypothetical protein ACP5JP_08325 [bacterium]
MKEAKTKHVNHIHTGRETTKNNDNDLWHDRFEKANKILTKAEKGIKITRIVLNLLNDAFLDE